MQASAWSWLPPLDGRYPDASTSASRDSAETLMNHSGNANNRHARITRNDDLMVSGAHELGAQESRRDHGQDRRRGGAAGRAPSRREQQSADRAAAPRQAAPVPEDPQQGRPRGP